MQVLLRNTATGLYYAAREQWSTNRIDALNLRYIEHAVRLNAQHNLGATEIIVIHEKPPCTLRLPITSAANVPA